MKDHISPYHKMHVLESEITLKYKQKVEKMTSIATEQEAIHRFMKAKVRQSIS